MKQRRIAIYAKDVQLITGKSLRYGQHILRLIRKTLNKKKDQLVTVDEYCEFAGVEVEEIEEYFK